MPKDRDALTPEEPEDRDRITPKRSAAREAGRDTEPAGMADPGPAQHGADPPAVDELADQDQAPYRKR